MVNNPLKRLKIQKVKDFEYIVEEFPIWANKAEIAKSVFDEKGIPNRLALCYFDISYITDQSQDSDLFF